MLFYSKVCYLHVQQGNFIFSAISVTFAAFHSGSWGLHPIKYIPRSFVVVVVFHLVDVCPL